MSSGDVFRSYQPSGDGRDIHLFMSTSSTLPRTSKTFNEHRSPGFKQTRAFDRSRTVPPARFAADGSGRDGFQGDRAPPATGKQFSTVTPAYSSAPMPSKGFRYATGVRAGYTPNGSGRDLQLFVGNTDRIPKTGFQFSQVPPSVKRYQQPVPAVRSDPPARTRPNGTGRDLFQVAVGTGSKPPSTSKQFSKFAPAPKTSLPAARTSPPPRYVPSGSGRDGFHRVGEGTHSGGHNSPLAFGFGPPRWDPATLHRPSTNQSPQRQRSTMTTLSRPKTVDSTATGRVSTGLLVPGSNLRSRAPSPSRTTRTVSPYRTTRTSSLLPSPR